MRAAFVVHARRSRQEYHSCSTGSANPQTCMPNAQALEIAHIAVPESDVLALPGFRRDAHGKPFIGLAAEDLYAFGHLIRSTEQLILDQFSRGLVSGTTHTCIGQELAAMAVVRA